MRFLLDVCVSSRLLQEFLISQGQDILSAITVDLRASDEQLLTLALQQEQILVIADKDFGELVFIRRMPHGPIVRLVELTIDEQVRGMAELLEKHSAELAGAVIVTVTRGRIRIRR